MASTQENKISSLLGFHGTFVKLMQMFERKSNRLFVELLVTPEYFLKRPGPDRYLKITAVLHVLRVGNASY